jgi:hypothetical protein
LIPLPLTVCWLPTTQLLLPCTSEPDPKLMLSSPLRLFSSPTNLFSHPSTLLPEPLTALLFPLTTLPALRFSNSLLNTSRSSWLAEPLRATAVSAATKKEHFMPFSSLLEINMEFGAAGPNKPELYKIEDIDLTARPSWCLIRQHPPMLLIGPRETTYRPYDSCTLSARPCLVVFSMNLRANLYGYALLLLSWSLALAFTVPTAIATPATVTFLLALAAVLPLFTLAVMRFFTLTLPLAPFFALFWRRSRALTIAVTFAIGGTRSTRLAFLLR